MIFHSSNPLINFNNKFSKKKLRTILIGPKRLKFIFFGVVTSGLVLIVAFINFIAVLKSLNFFHSNLKKINLKIELFPFSNNA